MTHTGLSPGIGPELYMCGFHSDLGVIARAVRSSAGQAKSQAAARGGGGGGGGGHSTGVSLESIDLQLLVAFVKHAGEELLGIVSRRSREVRCGAVRTES